MSSGLLLVCLRAEERSFFTDNITGSCADCGVAIVWRPHAPDPATRICLACARVRLTDGQPHTVGVTKETIVEAALVLSETKDVH